MWYFTWILGLAFASAFAILNAMWYEIHDDRSRADAHGGEKTLP